MPSLETEALAISPLRKCKHFLQGLQYVTDHRPLLGIFSKALSDVENPRLQRIRTQTLVTTLMSLGAKARCIKSPMLYHGTQL